MLEYNTMRECHDVLVDLLEPDIDSLGDVLFARGLIPEGIINNLRRSSISPADKTRDVVYCMTKRARRDRGTYQKFLNILKEQGQWTEVIVEKLTSCYESQTATFESSSVSSELKSKLLMVIEVPHDQKDVLVTTLENMKIKIHVTGQVSKQFYL